MSQHRKTLIAMRDHVGNWAAEHHTAELMALMQPWIKNARPGEDGTQTAISFAMVGRTPSGDSLVERYMAAGHHHNRAERNILSGWANSRFTLLQVLDIELDHGLHVRDLMADERLFVPERSGTHGARVGMWLVAGLCRFGARWEFDGGLIPVPAALRHNVVLALLGDEPRAVRAVEVAYLGVPLPRFENADGHLAQPVELTLDIGWDALIDLAHTWPDSDIEDDEVRILSESAVKQLGRLVIRASFRSEDGQVILSINSAEREQMALSRLPHVNVLVRNTTQMPDSDPKGPVMTVDISIMEASPDGAEVDPMASYIRTWPDLPIPALDGLTPRQAAAAGRTAEVRALAPDQADGRFWQAMGMKR